MHHDVVLRAPSFLGGGAGPAVVRRADQRLVEALFRDLSTAEGRARLRDQLVPGPRGDESTLYLPVHRCHNIVLVEAYCAVPGRPRVDPRKLVGAGVVVRRRRGAGRPERWLRAKGQIHGWVPAEPEACLLDPEVARRPVRGVGNVVIDRALTRRRTPAAPEDEAFVRLHAVPPDVCEALGTTLLFAVLQPVEPHLAEVTPTDTPQVDDATARTLMPGWLRSHTTPSPVPPRLAGGTFRATDVGTADRPDLRLQRSTGGAWSDVLDLPAPWNTKTGGTLQDEAHFIRMIWQVAVEWDAFGARAESGPLRDALDGVPLPLGGGAATTLGAFLRSANDVFVRREPGASVRVPAAWPTVPTSLETTLRAGVRAALQAQVSRFSSTEARYGDPAAVYDLHAFARVATEPGCPPVLVWTREPARGFRVARWFESSPCGVAVPAIELPDLSRDTLKRLGPNFAVKVPRSLFNFLQNNDPKDLVAGDAKNDQGGPAFQWICSLNLSITFMVAFMLLISFVFMLNFVFWWVPFFRICIPIPAKPEAT